MSRRPVVALVGRPNVGKSTLFNRLIRRLRAIVADEPGVTRDRLFAEAVLEGPDFEVAVTLVDTGGLDPDTDDPIFARVLDQTQLAIDEADVVVFIVDGRAGLVPADIEIARRLRRSGKPLILAVNKVESFSQENLMTEFGELGFDATFFISSSHGRNVGELTEAVVVALGPLAVPLEDRVEASDAEEASDPGSESVPEAPEPVRIAFVGRPNAGKSSLVNRLLGEDRHLVSDMAGTTRDSVDSKLSRGGRDYVFVDTAGIRRKSSIALRLERYSVFAARKGLESSDVALLLLDATQTVADQDAKVAAFSFRAGKAVILIVSKWDARKSETDQKTHLEYLRAELPHLSYAPVVFTSAHTGFGCDKILPTVDRVMGEYSRRVATGELNRFLEKVVTSHPMPSRKGRHARVYYVRQIGARPPRFLATVNDPDLLHFSWRRHLLNELRSTYGFDGVPILVGYRGKKKKLKA